MGDAVRIPIVRRRRTPRFLSVERSVGGLGLWNTHLKGPLQIRFFPPINDISHFEITHPFNLKGTMPFCEHRSFTRLAQPTISFSTSSTRFQLVT